MPSAIHTTTAYNIASTNEGSLVEITVKNTEATGGATLTDFVVTAIYVGNNDEYIWSQSVTSLAPNDSQKFNLSIENEIYNDTNLHVGLAFLNSIP